MLLRAALEGASLLEMPPARLEELASLLGNQGMEALLQQQALPAETCTFSLPPDLETVPFPVPGDAPALTGPPAGLAAEATGRAFDPAGLSY